MPSASLTLPLSGSRVRIVKDEGGGPLAIIRQSDGERVGRLSLSFEGAELTVDELCVLEPHRGCGCGSDAGHLLVHAAQAAGFRRIRAWAPPDRGLAVYFWLRTGLRPQHGQGPDGGIWLERILGEGGTLRDP